MEAPAILEEYRPHEGISAVLVKMGQVHSARKESPIALTITGDPFDYSSLCHVHTNVVCDTTQDGKIGASCL